MRRRILIIAFLFLSMHLYAQDTINTLRVNEQTYNYYVQKNWKKVIEVGTLALKHHIDYYYLRMRIGIAYFEEHKYRLAERHFYKALDFNANSETALEDLYYCYIYTGDYDRATKLTLKFPKSLSQQLKTDTIPGLNYLYTEGGQKISSTNPPFGNANYFQAGFDHRLGRNVSVLHSYTHYKQTIHDAATTQNEYYGAVSVLLGKTWKVVPAFHVLGYSSITTISIVPPQPPPPMPPRPEQTKTITSKETDMLGSILLEKSFAFFDLSGSFAFSNLDSNSILQGNISVCYYPLANNHLWLKGSYFTLNNRDSIGYGYKVSLGLMPFKKLLLTGAYYNGNVLDYCEGNGFYVNNSSQLTTNAWTFSASLFLGKHFTLYTTYQLENKKELSTQALYYYNTVIGGLSYHF